MTRLLIIFCDGEVLAAETADLHFDLPVIEAEITNVDSNGERAILPLAGIRQIIVGDPEPAPAEAELATWDRAAFHFLDGQVMRAWIAPDVLLGAHGGIWPVVEPDGEELRRLAIPYSALKGVFRLRQWDGRSAGERAAQLAGTAVHLEHMVAVLAEREARASGRQPARGGQGLLERVRAEAGEEPPSGARVPPG
ncbi:MAG TPA: hypothetical protein VI316_09010 [Candidatus Dormibacteraeota bacterium]